MTLTNKARTPRQTQDWRCAFCGEPGRRSREHVLAQWMRDVLGPLPMQRTTHGFGFGTLDDQSAYATVSPITKTSQNSLLHQVTRTVCTTCNNGWMSHLEQQVRPLLTRLLTGSTTLIPSEMGAVLARWAIKTSWTSELAGLGDQNQDQTWLPALPRRDLAAGKALPATSRVWLATCTDRGLCQQIQAHVSYDRTSPPPPGEEPRRILASCLILNGIALLVYHFDHRAAFPPPLAPMKGLLLWPQWTTVEFPSPPASLGELHLAMGRYTPWLSLHERPFDHMARILR